MEWKRDSSELRTAWPYPVMEHVVKLHVEARLDSEQSSSESFKCENWAPGATTDPVDARAVWDIYLLDISWERITVHCSLTVDDPAGLKSAVLPPDHAIPLEFSLLLRCYGTRWRKAVTSQFNSGSASIGFSLSRADIAGDVEIQPLVILADVPSDALPGWASRQAAKVATGYSVCLRPDEPLEGPGKGIEVKWERFDDSIANALYRLAIVDNEKVRLLLNNRHPGLKPVLDNRSRARNERTVLRDSVFSFIAADVWQHLADAASNSAPEEGEELPELFDRILRTLSRRLEMDREDIRSLFDSDTDPEERAMLHTRLQNHLSVAANVENAVLNYTSRSDRR